MKGYQIGAAYIPIILPCPGQWSASARASAVARGGSRQLNLSGVSSPTKLSSAARDRRTTALASNAVSSCSTTVSP